jgi:hypothetical protein
MMERLKRKDFIGTFLAFSMNHNLILVCASAFGWLYDNHPRTAITNLHVLVEPVCVKSEEDPGRAHGYWKDLLNIIALATVDELSNIAKPSRFLHDLPEHKGRIKHHK